jgi:hypothetical protein
MQSHDPSNTNYMISTYDLGLNQEQTRLQKTTLARLTGTAMYVLYEHDCVDFIYSCETRGVLQFIFCACLEA